MQLNMNGKAERIMFLSVFFENALRAEKILEAVVTESLKNIKENMYIFITGNEMYDFKYPVIPFAVKKEFLHYNAKKMMAVKS